MGIRDNGGGGVGGGAALVGAEETQETMTAYGVASLLSETCWLVAPGGGGNF